MHHTQSGRVGSAATTLSKRATSMMMMMTTTTTVLIMFGWLLLPGQVCAHAGFSNFFVNGQDQGDGTCVRMNTDDSRATFPVTDLGSSAMACGFYGTQGVSRVCAVPDGASITFEWRLSMQDASRGAIDPSHKGPASVYMKRVSSGIDDPGTGSGWFKIWHSGLENGEWATERLINNNGHMTVNIPPGLKGGYYLIRPELIALQTAHSGHPEVYTGCAQIFLKSSGERVPSKTVYIPGHTSLDDPGMTFNIFRNRLPDYPIPGPPVTYLEDFSSSRQVDYHYSENGANFQTQGKIPENAIAMNSNWVGFEVPEYHDERSCWASSQNCWDQSDVCYSSAPPTGSKGCDRWAQKCHSIQRQCRSGYWNGPPNYNELITPLLQKREFVRRAKAGDGQGKKGNDQKKDKELDNNKNNQDTSDSKYVLDKIAERLHHRRRLRTGLGHGHGHGHASIPRDVSANDHDLSW